MLSENKLKTVLEIHNNVKYLHIFHVQQQFSIQSFRILKRKYLIHQHKSSGLVSIFNKTSTACVVEKLNIIKITAP